ncbi:hypothetical protein KY084_11110 [Stakelama sp. CBK3Z-3]|uniref:DUF2178 domain-containing protein n=1 Tax=Stakelama flava TaxID=2860338 RepID=A0ABS6XNG2_9SPHN|nr:hypothetical protein [Stakelama flava]MBW4331414.1 hypothetical protein [Stakelama flava]
MAYKEKIAWLTLGSMLVAYGVYFSLLALYFDPAAPDGPRILRMLILFGSVTIVQAIFVAIVAAIIAIGARRAGEDRPDERDRAIARRGTNAAYFVLMTGMILVGVVMPFGDPRWKITNAALLALVIAEATRHTLIIASYRRGWHG